MLKQQRKFKEKRGTLSFIQKTNEITSSECTSSEQSMNQDKPQQKILSERNRNGLSSTRKENNMNGNDDNSMSTMLRQVDETKDEDSDTCKITKAFSKSTHPRRHKAQNDIFQGYDLQTTTCQHSSGRKRRRTSQFLGNYVEEETTTNDNENKEEYENIGDDIVKEPEVLDSSTIQRDATKVRDKKRKKEDKTKKKEKMARGNSSESSYTTKQSVLVTARNNESSFNDVGKRISIKCRRGENRLATIIKHDKAKGKHIIQFDHDGQEQEVELNSQQFSWVTQPCTEVSLKKTQRKREKKARDDKYRSMVGRKFEYTTSAGKRKNYKILSYDKKTEMHEVKNDTSKKSRMFDLSQFQRENFRWLDTIAVLPGAQHRTTDLNASKFVGVHHGGRLENSWIALAPSSKDAARRTYVGTFATEKEAALAHDFYARRVGCDKLNFLDESYTTEREVLRRRKLQPDTIKNPPVKGKSKYRGVHWQKNRQRWMARYSHHEEGKKHTNLGAFLEAKHAALAFDHEARKQGRPSESLNFPNQTVSEEQIKAWSTNDAHYRHMGSKRAKSSAYRGVTNPNYSRCGNNPNPWKAQVNIYKIVKILGKEKGPVQIGAYPEEKQAALAFDCVCRKYGVEEQGLNFPRHEPLSEVRLFDSSCYYCQKEIAIDSVATKCNHVFCKKCIVSHLGEHPCCPCCQTKMSLDDDDCIRPVKLNVWPNKGNDRWKNLITDS